MQLKSLSVRHWRNIRALDLTGLAAPLVVLYGRNGTGKSNLFSALRAAFFDDYNSTAAGIKQHVNWFTGEPPEVQVEFSIGSDLYRLQKRFHNGKQGLAKLEKATGSGTWSVLAQGKEVKTPLAQLTGIQKLDDGLHQLLWLPQGTTALPEKLGATLQQRFEQVLGSLLTQQDLRLIDTVREAARNYFTNEDAVKLSTAASNPIEALNKQLQEASAKVLQYQQEWTDSARKRAELQQNERTREEQQRLIQAERKQVESLEERTQAIEARRFNLEKAKTTLEQAKSLCDAARSRFTNAERLAGDLARLSPGLQQLRDQIETQQQIVQSITAELDLARQQVQSARERCDAAELSRRTLDHKRRLRELIQQREQLAQKQLQVEQILAQQSDLNDKISSLAAPSAEELRAWRKNREEAIRLQAHLEAQSWELQFLPERPVEIALELDDSARTVNPASGEQPLTVPFQQSARMEIAGVGAWSVRRLNSDRNVADQLRKLQELDREFTAALQAYQSTPETEGVLDRLAERTAQSAAWQTELAQLQKELQRLVPKGAGMLQSELQQLAAKVAATWALVAHDREMTADDIPTEEELHREQQLSEERERSAAAMLTDVEQQQAQRQQSSDRAAKKLMQLREEFVREESRSHQIRDELARIGDRLLLQEELSTAEKLVTEREQQVQSLALTADEQQLTTQLAERKRALERKEQALRGLEAERLSALDRLRDLQGLHDKLVQAEGHRNRLQEQLERHQREAAAYKRLIELFRETRALRVQKTTDLIGTRVLHWARELGLSDARQLDFMNRKTGREEFLPTGLVRADQEQSHAFQEESHGTAEQLALLIRMAAGAALSREERQVAILDDPLTHADAFRHRLMLELLQQASQSGLQIILLTCHAERFDHLPESIPQINLAEQIANASAALPLQTPTLTATPRTTPATLWS